MNNQYGGEVIGAGGFGCVFKPQLKCIDHSIPYDPSGISKLLYVEHANAEMKEISNIIPIINSILNNQLYFLPNKVEKFYDCQISKFSSEDIENIKKCSRILERGDVPNLSLKTLNQNYYKNKFRIIQQPYGGQELYKYIQNLDSKLLDISDLQDINNKLQDVNNKLCDLLKNGIKPMNDAGLLHHDIKAENILYDEINAKLIDWGLSKNLNNTELQSIAEKCSHESNFNTLPTNILLHFIKSNSKDLDIYGRIITIFNKYKNLNYTIIPKILKRELKDNNSIINFLNEFISPGIEIYRQGKIKYFKDIYAKNCDIFGFLTCYVDIIERINKKLDIIEHNNKILKNQANIVKEHQDALIKVNEQQIGESQKLTQTTSAIDNFSKKYFIWFKVKAIIENLKKLCLHYMYSKAATEAIDVDKLNDDLVSVFNGINFEIQSGGKKILKKYKRNKGKTVKRNKIKTVKRNKIKIVKRNKRKTKKQRIIKN